MGKYRGILATPMIESKYSDADVMLRFAAILDHYGIALDDPEQDRKLALALLREHVPGFRMQPKGGRPPEYDEKFVWDLIYDFCAVRQMHRHKGLSTGNDAVTKALMALHPYSEMDFSQLKGLRARSRPKGLESMDDILEWSKQFPDGIPSEEVPRLIRAIAWMFFEAIHSS